VECRPPGGRPACLPAALQTTTDASEQYNTGALGGPVIMITYFAVKRTFHAICNAIIVVLGSTGPMIGLYCINQVHHQLKKKIRIKTLQKKVQSLNIKNYCRKIKHL